MNEKDFANYAATLKKEYIELFKHRLPIMVGRMAKDHYQDNFRKGGFVNNGLQKWSVTRRQLSGSKSASAKYGPLLSKRIHLFSSVKYVPGDYRVKVSNEVPYAAIHNEGGTINTHPTVTPKMRKMAWARAYAIAGIKVKGKKKLPKELPAEARKWKALALTKKAKLDIKATIPQRRFLGESAELTKKINDKIEEEVTKILKL